MLMIISILFSLFFFSLKSILLGTAAFFLIRWVYNTVFGKRTG